MANTKERDASIGLDNHGFRYYDPSTGRYLTRDPLGYADGMNPYLSVHNNPINHIDPLGLESYGHHVVGQGLWRDFLKTMSPDTLKSFQETRMTSPAYESRVVSPTHGLTPRRRIRVGRR